MKTENLVKIMLGVTGLIFLLTAAAIAAIFIFPNKNVPERQLFVPHEAGQVKNPDQKEVASETPELVVEETVVENGPELVSILDECHEVSYDEVAINVKTLAPHLTLSRGHRNLEAQQICTLTNNKYVIVYSYEYPTNLKNEYVKGQGISIVDNDFAESDFSGSEFQCPEIKIIDVTSDYIFGECKYSASGEAGNRSFGISYEESVGSYYYVIKWEPWTDTGTDVASKDADIVQCNEYISSFERPLGIIDRDKVFYYCDLSDGNALLSVGYDYSDLGLVLLGKQGEILATSSHLECHPHSEVIYINKIENGIIYASCGYGDGPCGVTYSYELDARTLEVMDSSTEQYCSP